MAILPYKYFGDGKIPYVKKDWKRLTTQTICPHCIYYGECRMDVDCKALEVLVKICEVLDSGNPDN